MRTARFLIPKYLVIGLTGLFLSASAQAGSVADQDADGVPDNFDNCSQVSNGPLTPPGSAGFNCGQTDADGDGFGNACDCDNDGITGGSDFGLILGAFGGFDSAIDHDCDGVVAGSDFAFFLARIGTAPGPGAVP
jgi:hypothetical protein